MARVASESVARQLGSLFDGGTVAGLSDRQLLERFSAGRDAAAEAAFAALVARHGPMLLDICRELLRDRHHGEDAFQAVFMVLARRARSIRDPDLLGNWLYGVALRTARCARAQLDRRRKKEEGDPVSRPAPGSSALLESLAQPAEQPAINREEAAVLHEEIDRLPRSFRQPVVLCYFEGLTLEEAARRLRCPAGTLRSRLARAREKLRRALTRRGVALSAAALPVALEPRSASASISSSLCETTTRAAIQFAAAGSVAGIGSASAIHLARQVLRSMVLLNAKVAAFSLLLLATGAGFLARAVAGNDPLVAQQPLAAANPADANQKPAPGRMFVVGRVLDPHGKPVPGATVMVSARAKLSGRGVERFNLNVIGRADADGAGQFRLDAPRTSSTRDDEFTAIAKAKGFGVGWAGIDPDADQPAAEISLCPEQIIQGRLFDLQGRPAQGAVVSVFAIRRVLIRVAPGRTIVRQRTEGPCFTRTRADDVPAWPSPVTTDADGRFEVHGVGRRLQAQLIIEDPRFALQMIEVETDDAPGAKSVTTTLQPTQVLTGRVTYADTGKPIPLARLHITVVGEGQPWRRLPDFQTDADGRFRANPSPGDLYSVSAAPPAGQPYLSASKRVAWPKGAVEQSVDLPLPRGVVIRGKVTEEGSNQPIAGALVNFVPHKRPGGDANGGGSHGVTADDGSYEFAVAPRGGHLAVQAPSEDYALREIGSREYLEGLSGGTRYYSHSFIACDPKPSGPGLEVHVALRRGEPVSGRVIGPDDQPVHDTWIIGRAALAPSSGVYRIWQGNHHGNALNGRFELHGLDPDTDVPVYFFQPTRKLGATVQLSGKSAAGGAVTVRLQPCGTAFARLVDASAQPLARYRDERMVSLTITRGRARSSRDPADANRLFAEADFLARVDSINYEKEPESDPEGRITFPALIPGASYRIADWTTARDPSGPTVRKDFTVKPGETLDLGNILIEKPQEQR
jgi:RNA polymerase sigma factor (sigma-70 family)